MKPTMFDKPQTKGELLYGDNADGTSVWDAGQDARASFLLRTYAHLFGAVAAFVAIEAALLRSPAAEAAAASVLSAQYGMLMVFGAFMAASWLAQSWANSSVSRPLQYAGLGLYVVAQAVFFLPLMIIASRFFPDAITTAALLTGVTFTGLTGFVMLTRHDFSFLRGALTIATFAALGVIVASMIFGFSLGILFVAAMLMLAAGYILYDTSNVLHHYQTDQHVAAALALFASVALFFWYALRLVMSLRSGD